MATLRRSQTPRQAMSATTSMTIMIGSMIAAASSGGIDQRHQRHAEDGDAAAEAALRQPTMMTAGIAAA